MTSSPQPASSHDLPAGVAKRFLCDAMLAKLGRWLRAAGYDTAIMLSHASDRELVERARREKRIIVTRDRKLLEIRGARERTMLLTGGGLESWVAQITGPLSIDWLAAAFSRCLLCNALLGPADEKQIARLPDRSRARGRHAMHCRACDKLYWEGSHVHRMQAQLARWQGHRFG